jgi:hypothetical protein
VPTILIVGPYRFFFVSLDLGKPPHIHIQREKMVAKFWLEPVALERASVFKPQELNKLFKITQERHELLLEKWHEHFGN